MSDRALPKFPRLIAVRGRFEACDKPLLSEGRGREFESRRVRHLFNHLDNPTAARVPVVSRPRACALRSCAAPNPGFRYPSSGTVAQPWSRFWCQARVAREGGLGIARGEVPERSNGAVSKCAWRRAGSSRSIPASEVLCGFQPCCRRVLSRPILPCARPFGANSGANF
jgi:hypothetical protein